MAELEKSSGGRGWGARGHVTGGVAMVATVAVLTLLPGCPFPKREEGEAVTGVGFQGVVEFDERVLAFEMGGKVTEVAVRRGDVVTPGQAVAAIDAQLATMQRDARLSDAAAAAARLSLLRAGTRREDVRALEAEVAARKARESQLADDLRRAEALLESKSVASSSVDAARSALSEATAQRAASEARLAAGKAGARSQEVDAAAAQLLSIEAAIRLDEERIARHRLESPATGTVLATHVLPGEIVAAGSPVLTIADTRRPFVDVFVPQAELAGIRAGVAATVTTDAMGMAGAAGAAGAGDASGAVGVRGGVEEVGREVEYTPHYIFSERERAHFVVRVRVRFDDVDERLHAGVPAFVRFETGAAR